MPKIENVFNSSGLKVNDTPSLSDAESRVSARGGRRQRSTMGIIDEFDDEDALSPVIRNLPLYETSNVQRQKVNPKKPGGRTNSKFNINKDLTKEMDNENNPQNRFIIDSIIQKGKNFAKGIQKTDISIPEFITGYSGCDYNLIKQEENQKIKPDKCF